MSSKELPFIKDREGILEEWKRRGSLLQAVFIGANVGLTFTGRLVNTECAELRIARDEDELSINLLGAEIKYIEKIEGSESAKEYFESSYVCVLQITIDSGVTCTIYEARDSMTK
ncbi:MAG TPA: hypothetical protein VFV58_01195 [Blastocatellia bacterium]|jgi:hypothetical protein|nr:hypothetical protein [Blastocatellia bacterium]